MAGSAATTHDHVQRMLDQIHQNYTKRLTLGTLAKTLERQSAYLGRLFRDAMGVTVHEYITRARMMFGAAQVLSGVKVEAVALDLGYRSKKNFYRQFKRRFGMTPETYRRRHDAGGRRSVDRASRQGAVADSDSADSFEDPSLLASDVAAAERKEARPAALTRRIVRALVSHRVAMLATDETGCCIAANEAAVSITGYSVAELRRMPAADLFHSDIQSDARSRVQILLPASPSLPANAVLRTRSAGAVHVHLTSAENLLGNAEHTLIAASHSPAAHSSLQANDPASILRRAVTDQGKQDYAELAEHTEIRVAIVL